MIDMVGCLKEICEKLNVLFIYKLFYDKVNCSLGKLFCGFGMDEGLWILFEVKCQFGLLVLIDVYLIDEIEQVVLVVDVLQMLVFLCCQIDFIYVCVCLGKFVNIKKGQFFVLYDMKNVIDKVCDVVCEVGLLEDCFMVCECGVLFGYNNFVLDMCLFVIMCEMNVLVVFDVIYLV